MEVFKFGGASVKDAESVRNVVTVLRNTGLHKKVVIISAMGKTTNRLEKVIRAYFEEKTALAARVFEVKDCHWEIAVELFPSEDHPVFNKINALLEELTAFLARNKSPNYDFVYDQVICYGELLSTTIVSEYLQLEGIDNQWEDVRNFIKTDDTYREAQIDWGTTQENIAHGINPEKLTITQGFIASDENNFSTSLGREGSDYSAAVFAFCLNAKNLTIWKDVEGVLNGDPRVFENTELLEQISYEEAIELAFYGASIIHPKTLQPLQKKEIPLFVKSFYHPKNPGTSVCKGQHIHPEIPCFIVKKNLMLISLSSLDFSFIVEKNISEIFALFAQYQIKVHLIQNSAISFSICVENKFNTVEKLITHLKANYKVSYNEDVSLYTIRHFDQKAIASLEKNKKILLKQLTQKTIQLITKD